MAGSGVRTMAATIADAAPAAMMAIKAVFLLTNFAVMAQTSARIILTVVYP
jgi:hypothetical protein